METQQLNKEFLRREGRGLATFETPLLRMH